MNSLLPNIEEKVWEIEQCKVVLVVKIEEDNDS
jgi:hypothetical protein